MPAEVPPHRPRAAAHMRAIALWALALIVTLGLAGMLAWAGVLLAIFGLPGVALAVAVAMTAIGTTVWRRAMLPIAVLSAAMALPAAAVALGEVRFHRSIGLLTVHPQKPSDLASTTYRRGAGPVFLDLRDLRPARGTTTRVKAQSDSGPVIVALPHDVCLQTHVRFRHRAGLNDAAAAASTSLRAIGIDNANGGGVSYGPMGTTRAAAQSDDQIVSSLPAGASEAAWKLLAYGRNPVRELTERGGVADWTRQVSDPGAAKVELDLSAAGQIIVRDYPQWAAPLADGSLDGYEQVADMGWPIPLRGPLSPGDRAWAGRVTLRTPANRARWVSWEREIVRWGTEQARRYAGPCATRRELSERAHWFQIQPEAVRGPGGRIERLVGGPTTRHSRIPQPIGKSREAIFYVEVNGLGKTRVVDEGRLVQSGIVTSEHPLPQERR